VELLVNSLDMTLANYRFVLWGGQPGIAAGTENLVAARAGSAVYVGWVLGWVGR
jgi:hypothetical protein